MEPLKKMDRITSLSNISYNPIVHMALAGFFGWDFYISKLAADWTKKHSGVFEESTDIISDFEELGSLAVLSMVRETKKPVISNELSLILRRFVIRFLVPILSLVTMAKLDNKSDYNNRFKYVR